LKHAHFEGRLDGELEQVTHSKTLKTNSNEMQFFYNCCWVFSKFQLPPNNTFEWYMIWRSLKQRANLLWLFGNFWWSYHHAHWHTMFQIPKDIFANTFEVVSCKNHDLFYGLHHYNHNKLFLVNHKTTWSVQKLCFHVKCKDKVISFMIQAIVVC
jgi:hypothetical protein